MRPFKFVCLYSLSDKAVSLKECVYCYCREAENDDSYEDLTEAVESLLPDLVAETDCLECAPETVEEVLTESCEPDHVYNYHPAVLECCVEKLVWVFCVVSLELLESSKDYDLNIVKHLMDVIKK